MKQWRQRRAKQHLKLGTEFGAMTHQARITKVAGNLPSEEKQRTGLLWIPQEEPSWVHLAPWKEREAFSGNWTTLLVMVYSGSHKNSFLVFCQFRGLPGWHRTCALLDTCHMVDNSECCWAKTWLPEKFVSSCCCCRHGDQWLLQGGSGGGPRDLGQAFGECVRLFWTGDAAGIQFIFIYSLLKLFYIFKNFFFLQSCLFTKRIDLICFIYSFMNMRMLPTHLHFISPITLSPSFLIFLLILL